MVDEARKQKMREYFQSNKNKFAHYAAEQRDRLREEMVFEYGGCCQHCGEEDPVVLTLDHINDDAHVEKEDFGLNARGGHKHYWRLKKLGWPKDRFQLLCCNCNARKEHYRRRDGIVERWGEKEQVSLSHSHAAANTPAHNKSGIKGVFWNNQKRKWQVRATVNHKPQHLGFYDNLRDAAKAYKDFAIQTWGGYANYATEEEIEIAVMMDEEESNEMRSSDSTPEDLGF